MAALALFGAWLLPVGVAQALTVSKTTTFNPGFLWSDFTHSWTLTATAGEIPFDDIHITFIDATQIDLGSYNGPGGVSSTGNTLKIVTGNPGGFGSPLNFDITTVSNPTSVDGVRQNVQLTLAGSNLAGSIGKAVASLPAIPLGPETSGFEPGSAFVAFAAGSFASGVAVDLFQDTTVLGQTAQIGFPATAGADGSVFVELIRPLTNDPLVVGQDGQLAAYVPANLPEPSSSLLMLSSIVSLLGLAGWRRLRA